MQFHKKHGVFEACKKVCKDFFDTLISLEANASGDISFCGHMSEAVV